jgi:hypothetical protein
LKHVKSLSLIAYDGPATDVPSTNTSHGVVILYYIISKLR